MRIAALFDVHGNLPALEAVLAEVDGEHVDAVVSGGDLVLGPEPAACLELLRSRDTRFLRGNCERSVLDGREEADAWCADRLDDDARSFVAAWPLTIALDGVLYCHATPRSDDEIVTAATPDHAVAEAIDGSAEALVVCGHTHHQYERGIRGRRLANAGSVGLPYEGDAAAFWALVDGGRVEHRRTAYDVRAAVAALVATGFPPAAGWYGPSLVAPLPAEEAIAHFERQAGRGT